jgi:putative hydrolase of the HAD superfamily
MLDMDGTILDLAFDNFMWQEHVPERYALLHAMDPEHARAQLFAKFTEMQGKLEWYCLDHWSDFLGLDMAALHREQNHRIGYLPGAEEFLKAVREHDIRLLLVTNSHIETLQIKDEVTAVTSHFDHVFSSHTFGVPKERQEFWQGLREIEDFDPARTLFIDDSAPVLDSAHEYGIGMLLEITRPDTSRPRRRHSTFGDLEKLALLL